jgi:hypothetical protein
MPAWSLQPARRFGRSIAVWLAGVVLTGRLTHGRSYGELKRVQRATVARQLSLLALTVVVLGYLAVVVPRGAAVFVGSGLLLATGFATVVVGGYFAVTWYADYSLAR